MTLCIEWLTVILFSIEHLLLVWVANRSIEYILSIYGLVDLFALVLFGLIDITRFEKSQDISVIAAIADFNVGPFFVCNQSIGFYRVLMTTTASKDAWGGLKRVV